MGPGTRGSASSASGSSPSGGVLHVRLAGRRRRGQLAICGCRARRRRDRRLRPMSASDPASSPDSRRHANAKLAHRVLLEHRELRAKLSAGARLDLPDALLAHAEHRPQLLEGRGILGHHALADDHPLAVVQLAKRSRHGGLRLRPRFVRARARLGRRLGRRQAVDRRSDIPGWTASRLASRAARTGMSCVARSTDRPDTSASFSGSLSRVVRYARSARRSPLVVPRRTTRYARTTYSRISARIQ